MIYPTFTFKVYVTTNPIKDKNNPSEWAFASWQLLNINQKQLLSYVRDGYAFANWFAKEPKPQGGYKKKFVQTNLITLDFDDSELTMEELFEQAPLKPSICYTTQSDGIKCNRFRFIYVFINEIKTLQTFRKYYGKVAAMFPGMTDTCMRSGVQFVAGNPRCRFKLTGEVYQFKDIPGKDIVFSDGGGERKPAGNGQLKADDMKVSDFIFTDSRKLSYKSFHEKWSTRFSYFEHSETRRIEVKGVPPFTLFPKTYYEIQRKRDRLTAQPLIIKDGEQRRKKLYVQCLVRRMIKPEVTADELYFNLIVERERYFDNSDNELCCSTLADIVERAMEADCEDIVRPTKIRYGWSIDFEWCEKNGMPVNKAVALVRTYMRTHVRMRNGEFNISPSYYLYYTNNKKIHISVRCEQKMTSPKTVGTHKKMEIFLNTYDAGKTNRENLTALENVGLKMSETTLKRYKRRLAQLKENKREYEYDDASQEDCAHEDNCLTYKKETEMETIKITENGKPVEIAKLELDMSDRKNAKPRKKKEVEMLVMEDGTKIPKCLLEQLRYLQKVDQMSWASMLNGATAYSLARNLYVDFCPDPEVRERMIVAIRNAYEPKTRAFLNGVSDPVKRELLKNKLASSMTKHKRKPKCTALVPQEHYNIAHAS